MEQTSPVKPLPAQLERLGRYRIVRPLSKGGMAVVYEARREGLAGVAPRVAIKLILEEFSQHDGFQELFINEARLGSRMHHQNLVHIQDFDRDGDKFFLVMEYVEGLTLRRIISLCARRGIAIPLTVVAEMGRQACDGLHYAHFAHDEDGRQLSLVHRDVKPSNLILNPQGVVKVLDFGISKGRLTTERKGAVKGTWGYMAPEQAIGQEVGPTADIFALATVLYELCKLQPLFEQRGPDEIRKLLASGHAEQMAMTIDPAYGQLRNVLVRALHRDPRARYQTAEDFGRSLAALLPDPITARDEVTRFYGTIDAHDRGVPPPAARASTGVSLSPAPDSMSKTGSSVHVAPGPSLLWIVVGAGAVALIAVMVVAIAVVAASGLGSFAEMRSPGADLADALPVVAPVPDPPEPAPCTPGEPGCGRALAADEPPGPAGEGAPGEARPAPVALRGSSARPPPAVSVPVDSSPSAESRGSGADAASAAAPEPEEVQVHVSRRAPEPEAAPTQTAAPAVAPAVAVAELDTGKVVISAMCSCWRSAVEFEVYIDGKFVKKGPVQTELPVGRHHVSIVSSDGRRHPFEIDVQADKTVRRYWDFDRAVFR